MTRLLHTSIICPPPPPPPSSSSLCAKYCWTYSHLMFMYVVNWGLVLPAESLLQSKSVFFSTKRGCIIIFYKRWWHNCLWLKFICSYLFKKHFGGASLLFAAVTGAITAYLAACCLVSSVLKSGGGHSWVNKPNRKMDARISSSSLRPERKIIPNMNDELVSAANHNISPYFIQQ